MNRQLVDRIVQATLYEGYILYPYRPTSVKNQIRWTFGGVHPRAYSEATGGTEPWTVQTECLLRGGDDATITATLRFLQPVTRIPAEPSPIGDDAGADLVPGFRAVESLRAGDAVHRAWEEAVEHSQDLGAWRVGELLERPQTVVTAIEAERGVEELASADGAVVGVLVRDREAIAGEVAITATRVSADLIRVSVVIRNTTAFDGIGDREQAMRHSLVSTHAILGVDGGRWVSLADPPEDAIAAAANCRNAGLWPVLVGDPGGADDTVLASPIILDDHPQVAPESTGELFDSTEIDEILSLRILTLTDAEKAEVRAADDRSRRLLDRTESMSGEELLRLHGAIRELRPVRGSEP